MLRKLISGWLLTGLILQGIPAKAQEEKYDAVYLRQTKEFTLHADGSITRRYSKEQKLFTYRAFHNLYGETFIVYDTLRQKLKIHESVTTMADGTEVKTPGNAFNPVLPSSAANAPAYASLREMVITHTGLERNAIIRLDYEVTTAAGLFPALTGSELLAEQDPVKELIIRIRIPQGRTLHYRMFDHGGQPVESVEGSFRIYTWTLIDLPALSTDENQPMNHKGYPHLVFSTSDKEEELWKEIARQPAFSSPLTDEMKHVADTLMATRKEPLALALALQKMVADDIVTYPLTFQTVLWRVRTPQETWNSTGGTPADKALLLAAFMQYAGLDARVTAIVPPWPRDEKIGNPGDAEGFNVLVKLRDRGNWMFSAVTRNPVNQLQSSAGMQFIAIGSNGTVQQVKTTEPKQVVQVSGKFMVSSDPKLTGEITLYLNGSAYPLAAVTDNPDRFRTVLSGNLIRKDTSDIREKILNNDNGSMTFIANSNTPFKTDSMFRYFQLPAVTTGIDGWNIRTLSQKREMPVEVPSVAEEVYSYSFTMPSGYRLFTPVEKVEVTNKAGSFYWEVKQDGGNISVRRQLSFNGRTFDTGRYMEFKALMDRWNNPWMRQLVFIVE